jgi:indolepyruvate ferredoxin oxidoreductase alpha subunit
MALPLRTHGEYMEEVIQASSAILRGDQALAQGALAAGVRVVTGYPGSPATGVLEHLLADSHDEGTHVSWAPNEKVAFELAYGASLGGARALVVLKSVGLNIALDPLATMATAGCHAGLVIVVGDDPGGWGSQNEQDSRWLARVAEVPVVEPLHAGQASAIMAQCFVWSEALGTPLIVRITSAFSQERAKGEPPWPLPPCSKRFLHKRNRWVVLPESVTRRRRTLHRHLREIGQLFEASPYDLRDGQGDLGILAVGHAYSKTRALLGDAVAQVGILGLSSVFPLPEKRLLEWLSPKKHVLVLEEGSPFVEQALRGLAQRAGLPVRISGREDRLLPEEGELSATDIGDALAALRPTFMPPIAVEVERAMPSRVPLCADCPYRPTFEALLAAMESHGGRRAHIVVGETGCMVRANLPPLELFDVKLSLGSGLGLAVGLALSGARERIIALLGDSSFFHSDINALPQAAQLNLPIVAIVLDNGSTALTGGQAHPGSPRDERGAPRRPTDLAALARACGVEPIVCQASDPEGLRQAFEQALAARAFRLLIVEGPCPKYAKG